MGKKYPEYTSFEAMKRILNEKNDQRKAEERSRRAEIYHDFRTKPFSEIISNYTVKDEDTLQTKLMELLQIDLSPVNPLPFQSERPIYEILFPDLFDY